MLIDLKRFEDYKQEVILTYKKRKDEGTLPYNLRNLTTANMKKECLAAFQNRYSEKDEETFKLLFKEERNSAEEYFKKLKTSNSEIFKALYQFLKGVSNDTKDNNIELLAWLIDFHPRPHVYADMGELVKSEWEFSANKSKELYAEENKTVDIVEETKEEFLESSSIPSPNTLLDNNKIQKANETKKEEFPEQASTLTVNNLLSNHPADNGQKIGNGKIGFPSKFNKAVISFFAAFIIVGGSYLFYDKSNQCMYWNGNEYQTVACDQKIEGANILPKDTFRLKQLKRIKNISEITRGDIGKIYYSKVNKKVEFYTTGGVDVDTSGIENPTDSRKRLLPLTEHMYTEYVESKQP